MSVGRPCGQRGGGGEGTSDPLDRPSDPDFSERLSHRHLNPAAVQGRGGRRRRWRSWSDLLRFLDKQQSVTSKAEAKQRAEQRGSWLVLLTGFPESRVRL